MSNATQPASAEVKQLVNYRTESGAAVIELSLKRAVQTGREIPMEAGLAAGTRNQQLLFESEDAKKALAAYIEKRRARFKGE